MQNVSLESRFKFRVVNENNIQCEMLNLNSKKLGTFGNIPTKKCYIDEFLSPYLCGYRKGLNTQYPLLSLTEKWK